MVPTVHAQGILVANAPNMLGDLTAVFASVISIALPIAGVVIFVMLVIGGFRYITSAGDPRKLEGAKGTLTYAILGLLLIALAFLILVAISNFTNVPDILNFRVVVP